MPDQDPKIRLHVTADLYAGAPVVLNPDQAHYLRNVMRRREGDRLGVFNGRDGEWIARIGTLDRRGGDLVAEAPGQPQRLPPDLWLLFAPIRKARTDFIVEKATELGVSRIRPVFTRNTNAERLRTDRLRAHAVEAAEQCGETFVPEVDEPAPLAAVLDGWEPARRLMLCDEARTAGPAQDVLARAEAGPWAILTGPEGGFAPDEIDALLRLSFAVPVSLGPRVLRADTAAVAAITVWHAVLGDWRGGRR